MQAVAKHMIDLSSHCEVHIRKGWLQLESCAATSKILSILVFQHLKNKPALSFKKNDFYIHGEKVKLYSGSIHYFRIPRQYWRDRLMMMKEAGLNAIIRFIRCSNPCYASTWPPLVALAEICSHRAYLPLNKINV